MIRFCGNQHKMRSDNFFVTNVWHVRDKSEYLSEIAYVCYMTNSVLSYSGCTRKKTERQSTQCQRSSHDVKYHPTLSIENLCNVILFKGIG